MTWAQASLALRSERGEAAGRRRPSRATRPRGGARSRGAGHWRGSKEGWRGSWALSDRCENEWDTSRRDSWTEHSPRTELWRKTCSNLMWRNTSGGLRARLWLSRKSHRESATLEATGRKRIISKIPQGQTGRRWEGPPWRRGKTTLWKGSRRQDARNIFRRTQITWQSLHWWPSRSDVKDHTAEKTSKRNWFWSLKVVKRFYLG